MPQIARYRITHRTHYKYADPVAICQNQLRMMPRQLSTGTGSIQCQGVSTIIQPDPDVFLEHLDYYGNRVLWFAIESLHRELTVTVESEVIVEHRELSRQQSGPDWQQVRREIADRSDPNWLQAQEYLFDSPRVPRRQGFADYASESFTEQRPITEAAIDLTKRITKDFRYDTSATDVNTTTEEAFELRAGVCQDFAHVQLACLRSLGLPARYVSGYLRTHPPPGAEKLVGADESHAWVSLYAGHQLGWLDLDPTNACWTDTNHVPICIGRDYSEVTPMRGVVLGGGTTNLQVSVHVEELETQAT